MSDPYNTRPRDPSAPNPRLYVDNPPRDIDEPSYGPWIGGAVAIALVFGLGFWMMNHDSKPVATNPPPVVTSAPRVPAPVPDETTGQTQPIEPQAPIAR